MTPTRRASQRGDRGTSSRFAARATPHDTASGLHVGIAELPVFATTAAGATASAEALATGPAFIDEATVRTTGLSATDTGPPT